MKSTIFGAMQTSNALVFVPDMSSARRAASDIIQLLDARPEVDAESTEGEILQNVKGHIRLENVRFRALALVCFMVLAFLWNLAHMSHLSEPVGVVRVQCKPIYQLMW